MNQRELQIRNRLILDAVGEGIFGLDLGGNCTFVNPAAARMLGVPARYIGGYLWTGHDGRDYDASHAWAEAFVPDLGWVGFDPANRICPTASYIRASVGLDYWSAAPVRGVRKGASTETMAVKVTVGVGDQ